ncbi:putative aliphatic sulfonates-binding protein precursor [compost metagenome]
MAGKKIAVPRFSEAQTLVWWLMNHSGLNAEQIKSIEKSMVMFDTPDDAAKAFFSGQVDAAATWQPYLSQAQDTTGAKLLFSTKSATNIILDGIVFDKKYYDANKDTISKFIEGTLQASTLYTTDTKSIKDTFSLFATETDENIVAMTSDAKLATYADNVKLIGDEAQTLFVDMSNIWKNLGEQASPGEVKNAFDTSALESLKDKFDTETNTTVKVTEVQRDKAKNQDSVQSLLKKSVSINFQPNSAAFVDQNEAAKALQEFVDTAKILNGAIIQIEGNIADTGVGDTEAGRKLSEQRAKAVATYLQYQGVDPTRFVIVGNGISKPTGDNKTTAGQAQNRRTDIFFKLVE